MKGKMMRADKVMNRKVELGKDRKRREHPSRRGKKFCRSLIINDDVQKETDDDDDDDGGHVRSTRRVVFWCRQFFRAMSLLFIFESRLSIDPFSFHLFHSL